MIRINIKKIAAVTAAVMLLGGCAKKSDTVETAVSETQGETSITTLADTTCDSVSEVFEAESFAIDTKSSDDLFNENRQDYFVAQSADGTLKTISDAEYSAYAMSKMLEEMFSEEYYNEYVADSEYNSYGSYEEYKKDMLEWCSDEFESTDNEDYACIYGIMGYWEGEEPDYDRAARTVFDYVLETIDRNSFPFFEDNGKFKLVSIEYEAEDGAIHIFADGNAEGETCEIVPHKFITFDGEEMMTISSRPVPLNTKSLYISALDDITSLALYDAEAAEYDTAIYDYNRISGNDEPVVDISELAEKLPNLEKLFISSHIEISNSSALSKLSHLKELHIDVTEMTDLSFLSDIKVKKLSLTGVCCPVDELSKLELKELSINCTPYNGVLESIYKLKNVTALTIERYCPDEPIFTGIENLKSLKKLDISVDSEYTADLAPLSKLDKVEDLRILAFHTKNLDKISEMKSVRKLMLHSMDDDDLSFLSKMTGLEELSLLYVNSSFGPSLEYLDKVKKLFIADITDGADMSRIYRMKNLEDLVLTGEFFTTRGIGQLEKLKSLGVMLCTYSDMSGLKNCSSLEKLTVYNCDTPYFDAKDIEGMTQLKTLSFSCAEIDNYTSLKTLSGLEEMRLDFCDLSSGDIKELEQALPNCNIEKYQ